MRFLLVDIDSLRPDRLGCYGYARDTAPTIDAIAEEGVRFDRCHVSDSPCLPSRTALATCRVGAKTGVVTHYGSGQWYDEPGEGHQQDPERPLSFRHLMEHGIRTVTVTGFAQRHLAHHFTAGFQEHIQPTPLAGLVAQEDGADVTAAATRWLDANASDDDWLLHVNYWDVHHPYLGITPYVDDVRDSGPPAAWPDQNAIDAQQGVTGIRTADLWPVPGNIDDEEIAALREEWPFPERIVDRTDATHLIDGYDAAIRRVDDEVATLLATLDDHGVRDETCIIVTGDHGEAFGEHGIYAEHAFPDPACQRVPMVVSWPGLTDDAAGTGVEDLCYQFDLLATICDASDLPIPEGWDAQPFTAALRGEPDGGRDSLVCGHGIYTFGRAVYRDQWVYIRLLHPGVFSMPGQYNDPALPDGGLELLHDLDADPHMSENLVTDRPEVTAELRAELDRWTAEVLASVDAVGEDPLARMAVESGPFLYVDPEELAEYYASNGRTEQQRAIVDRARRYPPGAGD
ncbi:sulfatase [Haloarchaeobius sp. TZWSO28]|uniref:sulfatase n=1 Tax=Haloarchaeobius sp. TZWSO28 TaxID=3446119 RepID=UPI003EBF73BF